MAYYTDYPVVELSDIANKRAPIREVEVLAYDENKYVFVKIKGTEVVTSFKACYVYTTEGRCGEVPSISQEELGGFPGRAEYFRILDQFD